MANQKDFKTTYLKHLCKTEYLTKPQSRYYNSQKGFKVWVGAGSQEKTLELITLLIMYADDIIIIASSVGVLQKLLYKCEQELCWLGMSINAKKSCCLRVGRRCDVACANIATSSGEQLLWVKELCYLGVHLVQSRHYRCTRIQEIILLLS